MGLVQRGYQVTVISCGPGAGIQPDEIDEIDLSGVKRVDVTCFGRNRFSNLYSLLKILVRSPKMIQHLFPAGPWTRREMFLAHEVWKKIKWVEPDILHIHFGHKAGLLSRYSTLPAATTIVTWHGYDANCMPRLRGKSMYKELFLKPVRHTVGSSFMQQKLENLGAQSAYITQIPMGIDLDYFTYKSRYYSHINPLRIIAVGRLDEMKGYTFLIQAVSEILNEGVDIQLRIVGDGPLKQELETQILNTRNPSKIQLIGAKRKHEILSELHAADLFCLTGVEASSGRIETQGIVFLEAQATGLPVIGSAIGGVSDSLVDGETGLLCFPKNPSSIKKAIKFFVENNEAINEYGENARKFVELNFSINNMLDAFEALYQTTHKN